ncbi:hypothetical protein ABH915_000478 [Arthrobacter sp. MW3 TE3886]
MSPGARPGHWTCPQRPARNHPNRSTCPARGAAHGHNPTMSTPRPGQWTCPPAPSPTTGHAPSARPATTRTAAHAQPAGRPMDITPQCPLPGPATGHVPRRPARPLDMPPGAGPATTRTAAHAQPAGRPMDITPQCPLPSPTTGHVPRRPARPLDMSRGKGTLSAFMWFFIDKPTRTKIKSNNSTSCDGSHRSGQSAFPALKQARTRTDAVRNGG